MHDMYVGTIRDGHCYGKNMSYCVETELDRTKIQRIAFSHFAFLIPKAI